MDVLSGEAPKSAPSPAVAAAWQSLFLVVPMVSTTFASFGNLFSHLQKEALGWVFIDEAGQATPQQAVGALYRSQRAVIVGDPQQLEPIVAVPYPAQASLARAYGLPQNSQPSRGSVQILADRATPLGTCISRDDEWVWVGIPLRVHRRCDQPMFDIANEIAYSKLMVFGTPDRPPLPFRQANG